MHASPPPTSSKAPRSPWRRTLLGMLAAVATAATILPGAGAAAASAPGPEDHESLPGIVAVRIREDQQQPSAVRKVASQRASRNVRPAFPGSDGELSRWQFVDVTPGAEGAAKRELATLPEVDTVTSLPVRKPSANVNDPQANQEWHLAKVSAPQAWDITHSDPGTRIAVIDTQFKTDHPDLGSKLYRLNGTPGVQTYTAGCAWSVPYAEHGTMTAGAAASVTNNGVGVAGIGYDARVVAMQVGVVYDNMCVLGPEWTQAVREAADAGVQVISMSFGGVGYNALEADVLRYAASKGSLLIAAAGNEGTTTPSYPAAYPFVLSVSATDGYDNLTSWSNRGPWVDIAAPGENIRTTCATSGDYCYASGTSLSTPLVAGAAALMYSRWQGWQGSGGGLRLAHRLQDAADDVYGGDFNDFLGHGRLNVLRAVAQRAVRVWGQTRYETTSEIAQEAQPARASTVVLVPGDAPNESGWQWTLPAAGLLGVNNTAFVMTPRDSLSPAAQQEILRLFGADSYGTDFSKRIIIPGPAAASVSQAVQDTLGQRFTVNRIDGGNVYGTATAVASAIQQTRAADTVLIARADVSADAISLSGPAARFGYPLLFVDRDRVPAETCNWLAAHPEIRRIGIGGGLAAVPQSVEAALVACRGVGAPTVTVVRDGGNDRVETSALIAERYFPNPSGVILVNGWRWPDAVTGGAMSLSYNAPILLTNGAGLAPATADYVRPRAGGRAGLWVLGGTAVMSKGIEAELEGMAF